MAADIYTKAFNDKEKWRKARLLINVVDPKEIVDVIQHFKMPERDLRDKFPSVLLNTTTNADETDGESIDLTEEDSVAVVEERDVAEPRHEAPSVKNQMRRTIPAHTTTGQQTGGVETAPRTEADAVPKKANKHIAIVDKENTKKFHRVFIEVCCDNSSPLCHPSQYNKHCHCVRITKDIDFTTDTGLQQVLDNIQPITTHVGFLYQLLAKGTDI